MGGATSHSTVFPGVTGSEKTFREIVKPSVGSRGTIRLHFSNVMGQQPITIGALHIGVQGTGASVQSGTDHVVTLNGSGSVIVPTGQSVTSDQPPMTSAYGTILAGTAYVSGSWPWLPGHAPGAGSLITSYETANFSSAVENPGNAGYMLT